jgi:tetratricopeptide (TPR) repeat protein
MDGERRLAKVLSLVTLGAIGATVSLFVAATVQKIWGVDTWWQMAAGRWIIENGRFAATDVLSHSARSHPWIEVRWMFCVLMHWGWRLGGPPLLIAAQVALLGLMWGLMAGRVRTGVPAVWIALLIATGIGAGLSRWVLRPELVTYLFCVISLLLFESKLSRWKLWVGAAMLQVIWCNSHTLFAMGPVLAWMWMGGTFAERVLFRRDGAKCDVRLIVTAAIMTGACWINPYFHEGATFPILLFTQIQGGHVVSQTIGEMASPLDMPLERWTLDLWFALALLVVGLGTSLARGRELNVPRLIALLAMAYLSVKAQRNAALLAVVGTYVTLRNLEDLLKNPGEIGALLRSEASRLIASFAVMLGAGSLSWYVATNRYSVAIGAPREFGVGVVWWNTARDAVNFINRVKPRGPIFNAIRDGGYIEWASRDASGAPYGAYVDGRLEVYGPEFLEQLATLNPARWEDFEAKWNFGTILLPVHDNEAIVEYLSSRPQWVLVYLDHRNVVFVRDIPEHAEVIRSSRIDLAMSPLPDGEDSPPSGLVRLLGAAGRPHFQEGISEVLIVLGAWQRAVPYLEKAHSLYPDRARPRIVLAPLYMDLKKDASELLSTLTREQQAAAMLEGARRLLDRREFAPAARLLETVVRNFEGGEMGEAAARLAWADAAFQAGDFNTARDQYVEVLGQNESVNELNKLGAACEAIGDLPGAIGAFERSLSRSKGQSAIWNMLGRVQARSGALEKAAYCFNQALVLNPGFEEARRNLEAISR